MPKCNVWKLTLKFSLHHLMIMLMSKCYEAPDQGRSLNSEFFCHRDVFPNMTELKRKWIRSNMQIVKAFAATLAPIKQDNWTKLHKSLNRQTSQSTEFHRPISATNFSINTLSQRKRCREKAERDSLQLMDGEILYLLCYQRPWVVEGCIDSVCLCQALQLHKSFLFEIFNLQRYQLNMQTHY